jgi:hypothetical protein
MVVAFSLMCNPLREVQMVTVVTTNKSRFAGGHLQCVLVCYVSLNKIVEWSDSPTW